MIIIYCASISIKCYKNLNIRIIHQHLTFNILRKLLNFTCVFLEKLLFLCNNNPHVWNRNTMIDWVSIVRHSRRRFSTYVGGRAPIRMKRRRRTPVNTSHNLASVGAGATSPQHERSHYTCCCTQVSLLQFGICLWGMLLMIVKQMLFYELKLFLYNVVFSIFYYFLELILHQFFDTWRIADEDVRSNKEYICELDWIETFFFKQFLCQKKKLFLLLQSICLFEMNIILKCYFVWCIMDIVFSLKYFYIENFHFDILYFLIHLLCFLFTFLPIIFILIFSSTEFSLELKLIQLIKWFQEMIISMENYF